MKKIIFLIFALFFGLEYLGFGQRYEPCTPYKQTRNIEEAREILNRDGLFFDNLRQSYSDVTGYPATKDGINDLLDHSFLVDKSFVDPNNYENGVKFGNKVVFTNLEGRESDYWLAHKNNKGEDEVYAKIACLNPQKLKDSNSEKKEPLIEVAKVDTVKTIVVNNNYYYYDSIVHYEYLPQEEAEQPYETEVMYCYQGQQSYFLPPVQSFPVAYNTFTFNSIVNNPEPTPNPVPTGGPVTPGGHAAGGPVTPGGHSADEGGKPVTPQGHAFGTASGSEGNGTGTGGGHARTAANDPKQIASSKNNTDNKPIVANRENGSKPTVQNKNQLANKGNGIADYKRIVANRENGQKPTGQTVQNKNQLANKGRTEYKQIQNSRDQKPSQNPKSRPDFSNRNSKMNAGNQVTDSRRNSNQQKPQLSSRQIQQTPPEQRERVRQFQPPREAPRQTQHFEPPRNNGNSSFHGSRSGSSGPSGGSRRR